MKFKHSTIDSTESINATNELPRPHPANTTTGSSLRKPQMLDSAAEPNVAATYTTTATLGITPLVRIPHLTQLQSNIILIGNTVASPTHATFPATQVHESNRPLPSIWNQQEEQVCIYHP